MHGAQSQGINMLNTLQDKPIWGGWLKGVLAAMLLAASGAALAANVTVNLCAKAGTVTLPGAVSLPVWGYASSCAAAITAPGGPVIAVDVGDVVTVNLSNNLAVASGLLFQGQSMVPDATGAAALSGTKTYTFTANRPGTHLYEAALLPNAQHQVAMGLYGALIVRPAPVALTGVSVTPASGPTRTDAAATYTTGSNVVADAAAVAADIGAAVSGAGIPFGTTITAVTDGVSSTMSAPAAAAYGASTVYNDEAVLVLSEIDPALNGSANPAAFDMRNFVARYFLINGKAYPDTAPIASAAGNAVLLRYLNAGVKHHSMAVLGLRQNFVAKDAGLLPTLTHNVAAETLATGQTGDAIATVPASVTTASKFAVHDASLMLRNAGAPGFGGMLTFVTAGAGAPVTGPATSGVTLAPNKSNGSGSVAVGASINSASSTVAAAEYFIDSMGANGSGIALSGTFGTASVSVSGTLSTAQLAALAAGNHSIFVHGQDATGTWGAFSSAVLNLDKAGPTSSGLALTPNPSSGSVNVALHATGSDSATGGSNITAAEYFKGAAACTTLACLNGTGTAMTVNVAAPTASLDATIAAPVTGGIVSVHSMDALGNWGPFATITLNVASAPPTVAAVSANPTPNNGARPYSVNQPVVKVLATVQSAGSTIVGAEGFIDAVGANGSGFVFSPSDGVFNGASEMAFADIPLSTVAALSNGNHMIYVHGKDGVGNWGVINPATCVAATACAVLVIDKTPPTVSVSVSPANGTVLFGSSFTLNVTSNDVGTGVIGGQYWIDGTATPPANPSTFTGTVATINTGALAAGTHTVYVRVQDAATNWSTVSSSTLYVVQAVANTYSTTIQTNAAGNSRSQTITVNQANGVLTNDQPTGVAARTATPAAPVVTKTSGSANGSMTVALNANGSFSYTLSVPLSTGVTGNANIRAAKRGTYQFTYTETLNGITSTATVTITVN
jgi:hypothetical protein